MVIISLSVDNAPLITSINVGYISNPSQMPAEALKRDAINPVSLNETVLSRDERS